MMPDNLVPLLIAAFLAACVLWLVWRGLRRMFRSLVGSNTADEMIPDPATPAAPLSASPVLDAAEVLALKAAIHNLTQQVAALERRLAEQPTATKAPAIEPIPLVPGRVAQVPQVPSVAPDQRF